jgi:hypothetical protein
MTHSTDADTQTQADIYSQTNTDTYRRIDRHTGTDRHTGVKRICQESMHGKSEKLKYSEIRKLKDSENRHRSADSTNDDRGSKKLNLRNIDSGGSSPESPDDPRVLGLGLELGLGFGQGLGLGG